MSVIAELRVPAEEFELGRILGVEGITSIELENLVPVEEATVPLFWIHNSVRSSFLHSVESHPSVDSIEEVDVFEDRTLYTIDWDAGKDHVFQGIKANGGQLLSAEGTSEGWNFKIRFPDHDALSAFTSHCQDTGTAVEATRVYNPTAPDAGPWYGLSDPQREALTLAVELGYYDIPRGCTTKELAEALDISDQAVTERLRRAIVAIVEHTLLLAERDRAVATES